MAGTPDHASFRKLVLWTVASVYFLILVGGIVRSTGSGMGCPDWPKCFGRWVPPTEVSQLPKDYKEHYAQKRKLKNERIASYLRMLGFEKLALEISGDTSVYEELDFNAVKTWIEYLNRLTGAVIGLLIFAVLVYSFQFYQADKSLFFLSFSSFLLVGLEGWLGSIVVSTNLLPFAITIHMALALVLVGILIYIATLADKTSDAEVPTVKLFKIKLLTLVSMLASFIQILLGTQVRENIDLIASLNNNESREVWISQLGNTFLVHRSFSIFILLLNLWLVYSIHQAVIRKNAIYYTSLVMLLLLVAEILLGVVLAYFAIPAFSQPLHLWFGSLILGAQLYLLFMVVRHQKEGTLNFARI